MAFEVFQHSLLVLFLVLTLCLALLLMLSLVFLVLGTRVGGPGGSRSWKVINVQ
ncbi:hypothetical protein PF010_g17318 [Phytophthora fragariae]|uniref:Uncharacterized protein n=2 Tax=Phytophthora TaxID=4783 RepID=A0A6G0KNH4_9STRA|nr:hypothetical protein PR002_g19358 [Phytophthora rubi]KAE9022942.1 hypothetical protein PR001_g13028 [Phytophthora rubi]KAE9093880.1 hypothetical protein PF010_g17318 [Phytophthora fragariae]KAE9206351.1 hypothetical protein PF004_g17323 [Phytophthora fragariae]KAE9334342.1 hypothetical protein PR003_g13564 [Phytophthora rubi]